MTSLQPRNAWLRRLWGGAALVLACALPVRAQGDLGFDFSKAGASGFQFVKIGQGAREAALGEAAAALTDDAHAVFWNPGALPLAADLEARLTHTTWLAGSSLDALVLSKRLDPYAVAVSLVRFGVASFEETTVLEPDGTGRTVEAGSLLLGVAGARRFTDRLTIGVQAKYVRERLDADAYQNVLFDVGTRYETGFRRLRLAFALQHFGSDIRPYTQTVRAPLLFRVAAADDLVRTADLRLSAAVELVHPTDNVEWYQGGLEARWREVLALRTGYRLNVDEGAWAMGGGVQTPAWGGYRLAVDYAYVPYGDVFAPTHRFSVGVTR